VTIRVLVEQEAEIGGRCTSCCNREQHGESAESANQGIAGI
jgi:hypothetical protein